MIKTKETHTSMETAKRFTSKHDLISRSLSEFAGTYFIVFFLMGAVSWSIFAQGGGLLFGTALVAMFVYGGATAIFGKISGGHFNPAVSLASALIGHISWLDALCYCVAQVIASIAAAATFLPIVQALPTNQQLTEKTWWEFMVNAYGSSSPALLMGQSSDKVDISMPVSLFIEFVATLFVVAVVIGTHKKNGAPKRINVLATALAYGAGTMIAVPITGASLNPARSTGVAIFAKVKQSGDALNQLPGFWIVTLLAGAVVGLVLLITRLINKSVNKPAKNTKLNVQIDTKTAASSQSDSHQESLENSESGADEKAETDTSKTEKFFNQMNNDNEK